MVGARTFVIVALVVLLVLVIWWPIAKLNQKPSTFWIIVLLIPLCVTGWMEYKWLTIQQEATLLTQEVSGKDDATVNCQRLSESFFDAQVSKLGYVYWDDSSTSHVKYAQCKLWEEFLDSDKTQLSDEQIFAVGTIIHEAYHVKGVTNEAATQCYAVKKFPEVLKKYHTPASLIAQYHTRLQELSQRMPSEYLNGTC